MAKYLKGSVGSAPAPNHIADVLLVQMLLMNQLGFRGRADLIPTEPKVDQKFINAIKWFQKEVMLFPAPDGRADPGGKTIKGLFGTVVPAAPKAKPAAPAAPPPGMARSVEQANRDALAAALKAEMPDLTSGQINAYIDVISKGSHAWTVAEVGTSYLEMGVDAALLLRNGFSGYASPAAAISRLDIIGFLGPFIMFAGFVAAVSDAYDSDLKIYRAAAVAYTVTAWAYRENAPTQCKSLRTVYAREAGRSESDLDKEWRDARQQTENKLLAAMDKHSRTSGETPYTVRQAIAFNLRLIGGKKALSKAIFKRVAKAQYTSKMFVWFGPESTGAGAAAGISAHLDRINYPL